MKSMKNILILIGQSIVVFVLGFIISSFLDRNLGWANLDGSHNYTFFVIGALLYIAAVIWICSAKIINAIKEKILLERLDNKDR